MRVDRWTELSLVQRNGQPLAADLAAGLVPKELLAIDKVDGSESHLSCGLFVADLRGLDGVVLRSADLDGDIHCSDDVLHQVLLESPDRSLAPGFNQIQRTVIVERLLGLPG